MRAIEINPQFEQVLSFVNQTDQHIFLTGKAGTGKTTLLKYIKENTFKQLAVVAPTGVAAINANGSTIHSFFQFPFTPYLPIVQEGGRIDTTQKNLPVLKYNAQRLAIFRQLELLVIDEISMVRADLLDQVDMTLRQTRRKWHLPFGGVQVLMIGDLYQLPPVVQNEEWLLLNKVYSSPFFFDSLVVRHNPPVFIELEKIYRQSQQTFIEVLNKVRNNELDEKGLDLLNSHYQANISEQDHLNNITLTTHNRKADEINQRSLNSLPGKIFKFKCTVEGVFSEKNFPADEELTLKKGTRVMFLKNNQEKNYHNGKIGVVSFLDDGIVKVKCEGDKNEIEVGRETWTNVAYNLDKGSKQITEDILGTFSQYPLRLAWAITIHKSQGLTFDKLIIDAAESFSAGQVYVALSRCRSLEGLTLSSKIEPKALLNDRQVLNFSAAKQDPQQVQSIFSDSQRRYIKTLLLNLFDFSEQTQNRQELAGLLHQHEKHINQEGKDWGSLFFQKVDTLNDVAGRFGKQLSGLIDQANDLEKDASLQSRIRQASAYFEAELKKGLDDLKTCAIRTESKEAATDINPLLQTLFDAFFQKQALIKSCLKGFVFSDHVRNKLQLVYPELKINIYASARNTKVSAEVKYPALYRQLLLQRDEICNEEQRPIYMVANNKTLIELTNYLPADADQLLRISGFGPAKVETYGDLFLNIIKEYMLANDLQSDMEALTKKKPKTPKKEKVQKGVEKIVKPSSMEETYLLFREGKSLSEIAKQRGFTLSTIQGHLIPYIANGELSINQLLSSDKQSLIRKALEKFDSAAGLSSVKSKLPDDISFAEIRYMLADKLNNT